MNWPSSLWLCPLPADPPKRLAKERERLAAEIAAMEEQQREADQFEERMRDAWRRDPATCDRSPWLTAAIGALEAQMRLVDPTVIYRLACDELIALDRQKVQDEFDAVGQRIRAELNLAPGAILSNAILQNNLQWQAARQKLLAAPRPGDNAATVQKCAREVTRLREELERLRRLLSGERKRLVDAQRAREQEIERARARFAKDNEREDHEQARLDAVAALLK